MWARWRLIALSLTNEHISIYAFLDHGIIEKYQIPCTQMLHVVCFKGWMSSTPQASSCVIIFTISSNGLVPRKFCDSQHLSFSRSSGLHIVVGISSFCFSEYQLDWVVSHLLNTFYWQCWGTCLHPATLDLNMLRAERKQRNLQLQIKSNLETIQNNKQLLQMPPREDYHGKKDKIMSWIIITTAM